MKKALKITAMVFIALVIIGSSALYFFLRSFGDEGNAFGQDNGPIFTIPDPPRKDERVNVLLLGVDTGDPTDKKAPKRSDTLILASFDPTEGTVDFISIPRDTRVKITGRGYDKIGHAHAYGGPPLAMDTVGNFLGIDVHYYFRIDYQGFRRFVDNLGGVRVYVPFDMDYHDIYDDPPLHINLKQGWQTLNGEKALQLVRNRKGYPNGDIGRVETQQAFINAVIDKVLSAGTILRLPALADTLSTHLSTNMSPAEMGKYALKAAGIGKEDIKMYTIPGDSKYIGDVSYYLYDEKKTSDLISMVFDRKSKAEKSEVKVEILNGSGVGGLASRVAKMLEKEGFKIYRVGNVDGMEYSSTHVYDRGGVEEHAREIARVIGVKKHEVDIDDKADADVTVILGKDKGNL